MRKCVIHISYKYEFFVFNRRFFSGRREKKQKSFRPNYLFGRTIIPSVKTNVSAELIIVRPKNMFGRKPANIQKSVLQLFPEAFCNFGQIGSYEIFSISFHKYYHYMHNSI